MATMVLILFLPGLFVGIACGLLLRRWALVGAIAVGIVVLVAFARHQRPIDAACHCEAFGYLVIYFNAVSVAVGGALSGLGRAAIGPRKSSPLS